jgi:hypothetical protein
MANGHGGSRPGSGRKPKPRGEGEPAPRRARDQARVLSHPSVPPAPRVEVDEFDAPDSLTPEERLVWVRQAPFAFANGTLTKASALSFERYCRLVVEEAIEAKSSGRGGPNHRGMVKTLNTYELQFKLTACGKAMNGVIPAPGSAQQPTNAAQYW